MSTRACYIFKIENRTTEYYIHYDGYQEGAIYYFKEALLKKGRGHLDTRFLLALPDFAELTTASMHGDTEFQYTVNVELDRESYPSGYKIKVENYNFSSDKWEILGFYDLVEWINKHLDKEEEKIVTVRKNCRHFHGEYHTKTSFKKKIEEKFDYAKGYTLSHTQAIGNIFGNLSEIERLVKDYNELFKD